MQASLLQKRVRAAITASRLTRLDNPVIRSSAQALREAVAQRQARRAQAAA